MTQSYLHEIAWGDACRGALLSRGRQDGRGTGLLQKLFTKKSYGVHWGKGVGTAWPLGMANEAGNTEAGNTVTAATGL